MSVIVHTDGACSGNPGVGGWGCLLLKDGRTIEINGGSKSTTNNQMELTAAIEALKYLEKNENVEILTDSKYLKDGILDWIKKWKVNGWKTSNKKPVKNKDLWLELDRQIQRHNVSWQWVKGHDGNAFNERADRLARKYIEEVER